MSPYWPFYAGALSYVLFVCVLLAQGFRQIRSPLATICRRHFFFSFWILAAFIPVFLKTGFSASNVSALGLVLLYFYLFHYGLGFHLFGVAQRSISTNILVLLSKNSEGLSTEQMKSQYGSQGSLAFVTESRLQLMKDWGWISTVSNQIVLTEKGKTRAARVRRILTFLSLRPIGSS